MSLARCHGLATVTNVAETPGTRRLAVIAIDDIYPGSLASAIDVLQIANAHARRRVQQVLPGASKKRSMMSLKILSPDGAAVRALGGLRIEAHGSVRTCRDRFDAVILPTVTYGSRRTFDGRLGLIADLFPWLREQRGHGAIFAACSTGIMLLAEAGLLDDHVATISINLESEFRRRYPAVKLDLTRPIVEDRDAICAAAPGSSQHLVLKVVERLRSESSPGRRHAPCSFMRWRRMRVLLPSMPSKPAIRWWSVRNTG